MNIERFPFHLWRLTLNFNTHSEDGHSNSFTRLWNRRDKNDLSDWSEKSLNNSSISDHNYILQPCPLKETKGKPEGGGKKKTEIKCHVSRRLKFEILKVGSEMVEVDRRAGSAVCSEWPLPHWITGVRSPLEELSITHSVPKIQKSTLTQNGAKVFIKK